MHFPQGQDPPPDVCPQELRMALSFYRQELILDSELSTAEITAFHLFAGRISFFFFSQCPILRVERNNL